MVLWNLEALHCMCGNEWVAVLAQYNDQVRWKERNSLAAQTGEDSFNTNIFALSTLERALGTGKSW